MSDELVIPEDLRALYRKAPSLRTLIERIARCESELSATIKRDAEQRTRDRECIEAQKKEIERLRASNARLVVSTLHDVEIGCVCDADADRVRRMIADAKARAALKREL